MWILLALIVVAAAAILCSYHAPKAKIAAIEKQLPIWKVEQDLILSKNGDVTIAYEVTLPEIFTQGNDDFEALHQLWIKAVKVLPKNSVLHKQDRFTRDGYQPDYEKHESMLSRKSEAFFTDRPYLKHSCYIFITGKPTGRRPSSFVLNNLFRSRITPVEDAGGLVAQELLDAAGQFEKILSDGDLVLLRKLTEVEILGDDEHPGIIESYLFCGGENPMVTDVRFKPEFKIGDKHCRMFTLSDVDVLPPFCGPRNNYDKYSTEKTKYGIGFSSPVSLLLNCDHVYNQYIVIGDAQKTIKELEARKLRLQSLSGYSRQNAAARDATNDFLNEAVGDQRTPVKAHYNVLYWTDNEAELKDLRNLVSAGIAQMDATPREEVQAAPQLFWAGVPGNGADLPAAETFDTFIEQAVCFFNTETNYRTSLSSTGIRLGDRLTGYPMSVDLSTEPMVKGWIGNRNRFVLAGSGGGKSFLCNHIARSYYEMGTHVVIVDVGHSYRGLCNLLGGYYYTYEDKQPITFNPFYIADDDTLDTEKKESIKTLIFSLWKKDTEVFKRSEYVALSNALTLYFDYLAINPQVFPCFDTFYEYLRDEYVTILASDKVQEKDFDVTNFMYVLRPFYKGGEFDYLLNARTNLDVLNQRMIVFELDNIKDHAILFPTVTLIIMETFISKMRKLKGVRKMILIEEAWKAIATPAMAEYIRYLFKTVRKFFGEAMVVTQEVEDIISSPIIKSTIINNADCKILLDQSKYQNKFALIQELLGLTDKQKTEVLSLNKANEPGRKYKEVWVGLGQHSKIYRVEVSKAEYLTYTTEESEKVLVQKYADRYGSYVDGIAALVEDMDNGTVK